MCCQGGCGEGLRRTRSDAAGAQSDSSFVERTSVNTGTVSDLAWFVRVQRAGGVGRTDRRSVRDGAEPS
jgi:hypothetical protein